MGRRRTAVPAADRRGYTPGLKPRGHEDVLYATPRELLASLPATPADDPIDDDLLDAPWHNPLEAESDFEVVRAFLHRHGHRSDR